MNTINAKSILIFCLFLWCFQSFATVEWLTVNHFTKELYWAETGRESGYIGWQVIPEHLYQEQLEIYLAKGYSETTFPYKLEVAFGIFLLLLFIIIFFRLKKRKNSINAPY